MLDIRKAVLFNRNSLSRPTSQSNFLVGSRCHRAADLPDEIDGDQRDYVSNKSFELSFRLNENTKEPDSPQKQDLNESMFMEST